jgi:hypothetical protein
VDRIASTEAAMTNVPPGEHAMTTPTTEPSFICDGTPAGVVS